MELIVALEFFVCQLYGYKDTDINKVREKMFDKKFLLGRKSHRSIIVATLPVHIVLYILHSNYVARIWKFYLLNVIKCPSTMGNGYIKKSEFVWVDDTFPDDIMGTLDDKHLDKGRIELGLDPQDDSNAENSDD